MTEDQMDAWKASTDRMVRDPQPGYHFTEMLGSVAYIEARNGNDVKVLRTKIKGTERGWDEGTWMKVSDFIKWASYGTIPGYWLEGPFPSESNEAELYPNDG